MFLIKNYSVKSPTRDMWMIIFRRLVFYIDGCLCAKRCVICIKSTEEQYVDNNKNSIKIYIKLVFPLRRRIVS